MDNHYDSNTLNDELFKPVNANKPNYIKVIGVGGGGGNAVGHMMEEGIEGVDFILCNTDYQALMKSSVKTKVHLGKEDLGAGNDPAIGREAAEKSKDEIMALLDENTKMLFVTAGMGGGTGTGAAPVIAKLAKDKGILTVGIVTLPMEREGRRRKLQAMEGVEELKKCVDTLILISTDKLRDQYGNMKLSEAFRKADDVLTTAAKGIAEIITVPGYVNVDFKDVRTVMNNSGKAIMGAGEASGEGRAEKAIRAAIHSPLLNDSNIEGAKNILLYVTSGENEVSLDEVDEILEIAQNACGNDSDVIWGNGTDESLGDAIRVTLIATGFNHESKPAQPTHNDFKNKAATEPAKEKVVHTLGSTTPKDNVLIQPEQPESNAKPVDETPVAQPLATETPKTVENYIVHSLFDDDETPPEPIENEPFAQNPAVTPTVSEHIVAAPVAEEKPVVKVFPNPFSQTSEDEGFEITSRIMTKEEVTAKAAQEVAIMEAKKARENDPKEELKRQRLRALSMNFRTKRGLEELENQPAYLRRNIELTSTDYDDDLSHYSASSTGIRGENSFLHDNVD